MKKLLMFVSALLLCSNVQAKSFSHNISSGKVLISHTTTEDAIVHSVKAVPPPAATNSTNGVLISPIVIVPQNSDCDVAPNGLMCHERSSMLFECTNGVVVATQKCANGCDVVAKSCRTGTGIEEGAGTN